MAGNYSHTTRSNGTTLTATIYNADHQNHIDNATPQGLDDYSATVSQMQSQSDPGEDGTESQPTSLAGELERLRYAIAEIKGKTYWYETPAGDVANTPGRNYLNNPGFSVAQRGTTFSSSTTPANNDDTYTFDQWILLSDGNDVVSVARTAQTGVSQVADEAPYGLRSQIVTANKKFAWVQILSHEKTKALWKNANGVVSAAISVNLGAAASFGNQILYVLSWQGTADSVTSDIVSAWGAGATEPTWIANVTEEGKTSFTPTTSTVRYELKNVALDTASTNNLIFVLLNNDDATTITQAMTLSAPKLESGPYCTAYQERPYESELSDCQYYFWRQTREATSGFIAHGFNGATTSGVSYVMYPRPMRIAPSFSVSNVADFTVANGAGSAVDTTNLTLTLATTRAATLAYTVSGGLTDEAATALVFDATSGGFIQFSAEL